jgi:hypothetical protein
MAVGENHEAGGGESPLTKNGSNGKCEPRQTMQVARQNDEQIRVQSPLERL